MCAHAASGVLRLRAGPGVVCGNLGRFLVRVCAGRKHGRQCLSRVTSDRSGPRWAKGVGRGSQPRARRVACVKRLGQRRHALVYAKSEGAGEGSEREQGVKRGNKEWREVYTCYFDPDARVTLCHHQALACLRPSGLAARGRCAASGGGLARKRRPGSAAPPSLGPRSSSSSSGGHHAHHARLSASDPSSCLRLDPCLVPRPLHGHRPGAGPPRHDPPGPRPCRVGERRWDVRLRR